MKKLLKGFISILFCCTFFLSAFAFSSCEEGEQLTDEQVQIIRQAYFDKTYGDLMISQCSLSEVTIYKILGAYNGNVVFTVRNDNHDVETYARDVVIDGVCIAYSLINEISFWTYNIETKSALNLQEAYRNGYISKDDLFSIAEQETVIEYFDYNGFQQEEVERIREVYFNTVCGDHEPSVRFFNIYYVKFLQSLGTYNGKTVVKLQDTVTGKSDYLKDIIIDGIRIINETVNKSIHLCVYDWEQGSILDLAQAYENGDITKEDLENISLLANK